MLEKRVDFVWAQETIEVFDTLVYVRRHQPTPSPSFFFPLFLPTLSLSFPFPSIPNLFLSPPLFLPFLSSYPSSVLFPSSQIAPFPFPTIFLSFPFPYNLRPSRTPFPAYSSLRPFLSPFLTSLSTPFFSIPFLTRRRLHLPPQSPFPFPLISYLPLPTSHIILPLSFPLTPSSINPASRINRGFPKAFSLYYYIIIYIIIYYIIYYLLLFIIPPYEK